MYERCHIIYTEFQLINVSLFLRDSIELIKVHSGLDIRQHVDMGVISSE